MASLFGKFTLAPVRFIFTGPMLGVSPFRCARKADDHFLLTQSTHSLRYVLKNRATDETLFVVVFTLQPKDGEAAKEESKKEEKEEKNDDLD